jgi:hypothetical protein
MCSQTLGGVILISTRAPQDTQFGTEFYTDEKGPGMVTPGDAAMAALLGNHGYSCRLILDKLLGEGAATIGMDPATFLLPVNTNMAIDLAIMSGSGASADTPPPPADIPIMMGEHVCLGANAGRPGSIYMYTGTASSDPNEGSTPPATKYMKVIAPDHPILKGIPLDAQGRVKIFRDRFPQEELHVPTGGKKNYEYRWCTQVAADAAPCTTVLAVLDGAEDRACFAVAAGGGLDGKGDVVNRRLVHLFLNENGSGGSRRIFLALTEMGRVIFVRAVKWALGEELAPYNGFKITDVTAVAPHGVKLSWESSTNFLYSLQASADLIAWQTVLEDIPGADKLATRTLNVEAAPMPLFLRVGALP